MVSPDDANNKDLFPWVLLLAGVVTRIPFSSRLLLNMDSGQFALALEKFDVTVHHPHPPGYFLYVMLGRLIHLFVNDANTVFVSVSILFSGLTVVAVYWLGKEVFARDTGAGAALLALTSPNIWFHGEVALTYIVEAFFSTSIALFCWRMLKGQEKYLWISVVALGVAGGIRQNTPFFLLPLWLYCAKGMPPGKIVASLGLLAVTCLLWFAPMVWMSGGWDAYQGALGELWMFHTGGHGVSEGEWGLLGLFSLKLIQFIVLGLGAGLFPLSVVSCSMARRGRLASLDSTKVFFFSLWVLPVMMFYVLVFLSVQNPGYVLIFLPALLILASFSIFRIGGELGEKDGRRAGLSIVAAVVVLNTAAFFLAKGPVSYRWIRAHDRTLSLLLAEIRTFDPGETAVLVNNRIYYSYRHVMVYLPEYRSYNVDVRIAATGERRKTFGGVNRKTFLQEEVILPGKVIRFVAPIEREDVKYADRKAYEGAGIAVRDITQSMFIASGSVALLSRVYPDFPMSSDETKNVPESERLVAPDDLHRHPRL